MTDIVVVGGGIGGSSLAAALAREGLGVTVLEASTEYEDRVRGESMQAWGVREAQQLGVDAVLLDAGAHVAPTWRQFAPERAPADIPMSMMVEGVPGSLNLAHPRACQALADAAAAAGASIVRGATDVEVTAGASPRVRYLADGASHELTPSLVVGADGRASTVRRQAGITLERQEPISYIAGMLLDGLDAMPDDLDMLAAEGDRFFLLFHQGCGRARAYIVVGHHGRSRFAGPSGAEAFLAACDIGCFPWSDHVVSATPAGPVATYPGDDTWTAAPYVDGVVLVGDAAGHTDPIAGQGSRSPSATRASSATWCSTARAVPLRSRPTARSA